ncbi:MAG: CcmD family protein [Chitinophagales bacterium]
MKQLLLTAFFSIFFFSTAIAQNSANAVEMADGLRQSGKIYVVVATLVIIFLGILAFLFLLEKQVKSLEEKMKS